MAVTMTIGNRNAIFTSLFDPGQTISSLIANNWLEAGSLELSALIELGLVLMLVSLLINAFARFMVGRVLHVGEGAEGRFDSIETPGDGGSTSPSVSRRWRASESPA